MITKNTLYCTCHISQKIECLSAIIFRPFPSHMYDLIRAAMHANGFLFSAYEGQQCLCIILVFRLHLSTGECIFSEVHSSTHFTSCIHSVSRVIFCHLCVFTLALTKSTRTRDTTQKPYFIRTNSALIIKLLRFRILLRVFFIHGGYFFGFYLNRELFHSVIMCLWWMRLKEIESTICSLSVEIVGIWNLV